MEQYPDVIHSYFNLLSRVNKIAFIYTKKKKGKRIKDKKTYSYSCKIKT